MIAQQDLHQILNYDPETGIFTWKISPRRAIHPGTIAGSLSTTSGYLMIRYKGKNYLNHRLAYLYIYGYLPKEIDHKDRDKLNNKINNLRECTKCENQANKNIQKNNKSGYKGVSWDNTNNKWIAQIRRDNKKYFLGFFNCPKKASEAYKNKEQELRKI